MIKWIFSTSDTTHKIRIGTLFVIYVAAIVTLLCWDAVWLRELWVVLAAGVLTLDWYCSEQHFKKMLTDQ